MDHNLGQEISKNRQLIESNIAVTNKLVSSLLMHQKLIESNSRALAALGTKSTEERQKNSQAFGELLETVQQLQTGQQIINQLIQQQNQNLNEFKQIINVVLDYIQQHQVETKELVKILHQQEIQE